MLRNAQLWIEGTYTDHRARTHSRCTANNLIYLTTTQKKPTGASLVCINQICCCCSSPSSKPIPSITTVSFTRTRHSARDTFSILTIMGTIDINRLVFFNTSKSSDGLRVCLVATVWSSGIVGLRWLVYAWWTSWRWWGRGKRPLLGLRTKVRNDMVVAIHPPFSNACSLKSANVHISRRRKLIQQIKNI